MLPSELVVGDTYFMVTYPYPSLLVPIVITYKYLGKDLLRDHDDSSNSVYNFRYLPAFEYESQDDQDDQDDFWSRNFPALFSGWGEMYPTAFSEDKIAGFTNLDGLIEELKIIRSRSLS